MVERLFGIKAKQIGIISQEDIVDLAMKRSNQRLKLKKRRRDF